MIIIANRNTGQIREVDEGFEMRFEPGEYVVGSRSDESTEKPDILTSVAARFGVAVSDVIEAAAQAFDKTGLFGDTFKQCARCKLRKEVLHAIKHLGVWKSVNLIAKTLLHRPLNDNELSALDKLSKNV